MPKLPKVIYVKADQNSDDRKSPTLLAYRNQDECGENETVGTTMVVGVYTLIDTKKLELVVNAVEK